MSAGMRRGARDWAMAAEALLLLAVFRARLAMTPVKKVLRAIACERIGAKDHADAANSQEGGDPNAALSHESRPDARELDIARKVEWAVSAAARRSPLEFVCFPQTLAAFVMLRRRGVRATIVYGVMRASPAAANAEEGELLAHTWLTAGGKIVAGEDGMAGYVAVERWR